MTWAPGSYLCYACQVVTCVRRARQVEPLVSGQSVSCLRLCPLIVSHPNLALTQAIVCRLTQQTAVANLLQGIQVCATCFSCRDSSLRFRVVSKHEGGGAGDLGPICTETWTKSSRDISSGENSDGTPECDFSQASG